MKYIINEISTGSIVSVFTNIEDVKGGDYFYFKHLEEQDKKEYKDTINDRHYTIIKDDENFDLI